ncbi:MAG: I78 family peptidase inhibitor [Rhodospirillaceae bacterium]|nr:I78 family peptidase inhibitor [Rhodospirillaceae bacterium]
MHRTFIMLTVAAALTGCGAVGEIFADFDFPGGSSESLMPMEQTSSSMGSGTSIQPETLFGCRGHVLVPAMGMTFVPYGSPVPSSGQFLREESLTPPYQVLPPGAAANMGNVPSRLNIAVDRNNRIVNIRCG